MDQQQAPEKIIPFPHQIPVPLLDWATSLHDLHPSTCFAAGGEVSLANGLTGMSLLPLTLARLFPKQEPSWLSLVRRFLTWVEQKTQESPLAHPGLHQGSAGLLFTLTAFAQCDKRYQQASQDLCKQYCSYITSWNWRADSFLRGQENFEVIGGATGILRVLLQQPDASLVQPAIEHLGSYLLWLSQSSERWLHQPERLSATVRKRYPHGYVDLGMAHGLAGPLALLSLMLLRNAVPDPIETREAITRWASWLIDQHLDRPWGYDWPSVIPAACTAQVCPPARSAWCYGTPGIARALWLAGHALADETLCHIAFEALTSALRRQKQCDQPLICHGKAGLLLICLRFAQNDQGASAEQQTWLQNSIAQFTEELQEQWLHGVITLDPGFLTGITGLALTLLAALTGQEAWWDSVLLLS